MSSKEVIDRGRRMNRLSLILFVLGAASFLYFAVCVSYAGLSTSFTKVWGLVSIVCVAASVFLQRLWVHGYVWPVWIKAIIIAVFSICAVLFIFAESVIVYYSNQSAPQKVEYVVVLGARVNGTKLTGSLWRRLKTAEEYLKDEANQNTKVIVSGGQGQGEDISEAQAMRDYLVEHGVEESRIIMEDRSTNTYENIQFSRKIIGNDEASVAIVTNGFHIYRATAMAKKQGMTNAHGLSASSDPIMTFSYYIREGFAVIAYKIKGSI